MLVSQRPQCTYVPYNTISIYFRYPGHVPWCFSFAPAARLSAPNPSLRIFDLWRERLFADNAGRSWCTSHMQHCVESVASLKGFTSCLLHGECQFLRIADVQSFLWSVVDCIVSPACVERHITFCIHQIGKTQSERDRAYRINSKKLALIPGPFLVKFGIPRDTDRSEEQLRLCPYFPVDFPPKEIYSSYAQYCARYNLFCFLFSCFLDTLLL